MRITRTESGLELTFGGAVVAQAAVVEPSLEPVEAVSWEEAVAASASYPGHTVTSLPELLLLRHRAARRAADLPRPGALRARRPGPVAAPWVPGQHRARGLPRVRRPGPARVPGRHLVGARLHRRLGRRHHRAADGARPDDRGHRRPAGAGRAARRHRRAPRVRRDARPSRRPRSTTPTGASWAGPSTCGSPWTRPCSTARGA